MQKLTRTKTVLVTWVKKMVVHLPRFQKHGNSHEHQCVRNNLSSFATTFIWFSLVKFILFFECLFTWHPVNITKREALLSSMIQLQKYFIFSSQIKENRYWRGIFKEIYLKNDENHLESVYCWFLINRIVNYSVTFYTSNASTLICNICDLFCSETPSTKYEWRNWA